MRAGTPKSRLLGYCSQTLFWPSLVQNDFVLDARPISFLKPVNISKRHHLGQPESQTASFWKCFKSLGQNDVIWISDLQLIQNDAVFD